MAYVKSYSFRTRLDNKLAELWIIVWKMCTKRHIFRRDNQKMSLNLAVFYK